MTQSRIVERHDPVQARREMGALLMTPKASAAAQQGRGVTRRSGSWFPRAARDAMVSRYGPGLRRAARKMRSERGVQRLSLDLKRAAERFCGHVASAES